MKDKIQNLRVLALDEIEKVRDLESLTRLNIKYLGRRGELTQAMKEISEVESRIRPELGKLINQAKSEIVFAINKKAEGIRMDSKPTNDDECIDVTQPGKRLPVGHLHPTTQAIQEIAQIFERIGFIRERYPEVETDWYAFESLNMPPDHPARDEWETFFITKNVVLTPHTSSGQVREMEKGKLPIRMINISKCYRRQIDISHTPMFHQFEGLYIDKNVTVGHLKGVFDYFVKSYFGPDRKIRLRPFHFQFTEPSFEVDITCGICGGTGKLENGSKCRLCKEGWLELTGAGMVHPNVLKAGKIDPKKYTGFAFGWGVERTFMMRSGIEIDDIRILYKNDLRFLEQF